MKTLSGGEAPGVREFSFRNNATSCDRCAQPRIPSPSARAALRPLEELPHHGAINRDSQPAKLSRNLGPAPPRQAHLANHW
jgi:hypothetical protein